MPFGKDSLFDAVSPGQGKTPLSRLSPVNEANKTCREAMAQKEGEIKKRRRRNKRKKMMMKEEEGRLGGEGGEGEEPHHSPGLVQSNPAAHCETLSPFCC